MSDIFCSRARSLNDFAGVFEFDDEVGYFYLYRLEANGQPAQVLGAIRVVSRVIDIDHEDIEVKWSTEEDVVGLFIQRRLWSAFELPLMTAHGGGYELGREPALPDHLNAVTW